MHGIFSSGYSGLLESIYVQERITKEMMPEVYAASRGTLFRRRRTQRSYTSRFLRIPFRTRPIFGCGMCSCLKDRDLFVIVAVSIIRVHRGMPVCMSESMNWTRMLNVVMDRITAESVPSDTG
jgi:USP6 N-terminal-like protein